MIIIKCIGWIWFGNITRKNDSESMRIIMEIIVEKKKTNPKKRWVDSLDIDLKIAYMNELEILWRCKTRVVDPN